MNFAAHVWTVTITFIISVIALLVWFFGFVNLNDMLYADNLQDATRTALYAAQDKADRTERGSFVINKRIFNNVLGNTSVKQFGGQTVADARHTKIYFMPDDKSADSYDSPENRQDGSTLHDPINNRRLGHQSNGQISDDNHTNNHNISTGAGYVEGSNEAKPWITQFDSSDSREGASNSLEEPLHTSDDNPTESNLTDKDKNDYETIRGIRVVVDTPAPSNLGFHSDKKLEQIAGGTDYNTMKGFHGHQHIPGRDTDESTMSQTRNNTNNYHLTEFTATDILQTFGKNANNDTYNDLTR